MKSHQRRLEEYIMQEYILEAVDITKKFPGVIANDHVNLHVKKGEVLGLIGENGAGKSTILKILNGIYPEHSYEGTIKIEGREIKPKSTHDAIEMGIGFVPQEINVLKSFSVAENIYMSDLHQGKKDVIINFNKMYIRTEELLKKNKINLNPMADVRKLSIGQQQMLMIARSLARDPKILILDEPTTSLSDSDVKNLFDVIKTLKRQGKSIIFVTHKLAEILEITDSLCILRDGKNVGSFTREEYDKEKIIQGMIGRKIDTMYPDRNADIGDEVLRVENLTVEHEFISNRNRVEDVSFSVKKGEVLGLAGLVGAGRTEVVSAIFGMLKKKTGDIYIDGKQVKIKNTSGAMKKGLALVTEDRKKYGLIFIWNILKNITISDLNAISKLKLFPLKKKEKELAKEQFDYLRIKAPSMNVNVGSLSGGNQQKVVIARSLNALPKVIFLDEPTKGIDVGSKNEIYQLINKLAESGVSIVMISSELPELMAMCDRFIVLAEGRISGELSKSEATEARIMKAAVHTFKAI